MDQTSENVRAQMRKGVLEYCILVILSKREAYASSIIEELKKADKALRPLPYKIGTAVAKKMILKG